MSSVKVNMRTCGKTHVVRVAMNADGNFDVNIESDCHKVELFGEKLGYLTMEDIVDFDNSRINKREFRGDMSPPCLVPAALLDAAWLEAGMLSGSLAKRVKENSIEFTDG